MKKAFASLLCVITAVAFAGCASVPPPASPSLYETPPEINDSIVINVVTSYGGDDGNRQNYENAVMGYETATGNIVRDDSGISNEDWKTSVLAGFDAGTEPDVLFFFAGVDSNKLVSEGKVVPLDEIRAVYPGYASNMKDSMLPKSPVDGKSYAVPVNGYWEGLFVNKRVLADCGVDVPNENTTWEQFLEICQTIADKGYVPVAASLNEVPHYWFEFCIFNNGSLDTHATLPSASSDDTGIIWTNGLNDIKELYERGFFPEDTTTCTSAEAEFLMIDNKAAFMIDGSWKMGWFAENAADIKDFTVTYVPGKGARSSTDIIGGLSMGYFITKKAWDNPDKRAACVEFIEFMTADDVVATFGATAVTALINGTVPPEDASSLVRDALEMTRNCTGISVAVGDSLVPAARSDLFGNIKSIAAGTITAQDAIDNSLAIQAQN